RPASSLIISASQAAVIPSGAFASQCERLPSTCTDLRCLMKRGRFSKLRQKRYSSSAGFWMVTARTTWKPRPAEALAAGPGWAVLARRAWAGGREGGGGQGGVLPPPPPGGGGGGGGGGGEKNPSPPAPLPSGERGEERPASVLRGRVRCCARRPARSGPSAPT